MVLCVAQAALAVAGGMLIARSRGMLCVALSLHSGTWAISWAISAFALLYNPASSKRLMWFWCCALISNSIVLSSLRRASESTGRHLPIEIGCLSWISFFANAVLVVLQLAKPELEDTESVYVRVLGHDGVVPSTATGSRGWQGFWAGGAGTFDPAAATAGEPSVTRNRTSRSWWCFGGRRGRENDLEGGGAWPSGGGGGGTLNESLLRSSAFDERTGIGGASPAKGSEGGQGGGCFQRVGCFLRRRTATASAAATATASAAGDQEEGRPQAQDSSPFGILRGGASSIRAQQALGVGGGGGGPSSAYPGAASIGARAPPQVAAPVLGVAVSRWRLVDGDGVPSAHGSSGDVVWTERSRHGSSSSVRTATLSGSDFAPTAVDGRGRDHSDLSSASASAAMNDFDPGEARAGSSAEPHRVEFELLVRASGRGEMDWWGRDPPGGGAASAAASADGDWRVWRSAADTLALYDALALRFGPEFGRRVSRPSFKTHKKHVRFAVEESDDGSTSPPAASRRSPPPPLMVLPGALHRVDILSDAKKVGAFLRSLMGLRQFLSTAVMDYLAQPPPPAALPPADAVPHGDGGSDTSDAGYITSDDILDEDRGGAQQGASGHGHDGATAAGGPPKNHRSFSGAEDADGGASAGQAVAVAALATDYGAWLKRLAVRLRRATPAGERFVRLRCIGPAVTGEQVVWWLVTSSGDCDGDRATAVRLGQDLVSHRLLTPVCAGYDHARESAGGANEEPADLSGSFDDAAGWLFAFEGDALRNPFAPPPPIQVAVMTNTGVEVAVTGWTETSDDEGSHVSFVVHSQVEATQEAWDSPRRYREFTQLRKRLLRLGIDIPTSAGTRNGDAGAGDGGGLAPDLPKKTWRTNKFDEDHLETRRAALEAYLRAAVKGALSAPHLSGHLLMRFLDPDESRLRILSEQRSRNPFAGGGGAGGGSGGSGGGSHHSTRVTRGAAGSGGGRGRGARGRGGSGDDGAGGTGGTAAGEGVGGGQEESVAGDRLSEDRAEEEDFDNLTDSIGGFG
eukprot:g9848.t1